LSLVCYKILFTIIILGVYIYHYERLSIQYQVYLFLEIVIFVSHGPYIIYLKCELKKMMDLDWLSESNGSESNQVDEKLADDDP